MSINRTNTDIPFIHHETIVEWDIRSANVSILAYYDLCDKKLITKLAALSGKERKVAVGKMIQKYPEIGRKLEDGFTNILNEFLEANKLDPVKDIVSIKKDAIFVRSREIIQSTFGDGVVEFVPKNKYTGCILIPNYEFYFSKNHIDVKGVNDDSLPMHVDGVLLFVNDIFNSSHNWGVMNKYIKAYFDSYKKRLLPFNAYREFSTDSKFKIMLFGNLTSVDDISEEEIPFVDISYNYINVLLPIMRAVV